MMQIELDLVILSDSSAARGMVARQGSGKVKHLAIKELWIQDLYRKGVLKVEPVDTLMNWADLGTKVLDKSRLDSLMNQLPIKRTMASAIIASMVAPASAQGSDEADEFMSLIRVTGLVVSLLILLAFLLGRWSVRAPRTSNASVQTDESGSPSGTPQETPEMMIMAPVMSGMKLRTSGRALAISDQRVAPRSDSSSASAAGSLPEKRVLGRTRPGVPPADLGLRRDVLRLLSEDALRDLARELGVSYSGSKELLIDTVARLWQAGSARQLRYVMFLCARIVARPGARDLATKESITNWIARNDPRL